MTSSRHAKTYASSSSSEEPLVLNNYGSFRSSLSEDLEYVDVNPNRELDQPPPYQTTKNEINIQYNKQDNRQEKMQEAMEENMQDDMQDLEAQDSRRYNHHISRTFHRPLFDFPRVTFQGASPTCSVTLTHVVIVLIVGTIPFALWVFGGRPSLSQ